VSDTPQTDQAESSALEVGQWHLAKLCRQLERENAALKAALDAQMKYQRDLRADRDRIDWILSDDGGFFIWWNYDIDEWTPQLKATRDWIDIAMKEKR
jgi:hypothetical protein